MCASCEISNPLSVHQCMTLTALKASAEMLQVVADEQTKPDQPILKIIKGVDKARA